MQGHSSWSEGTPNQLNAGGRTFYVSDKTYEKWVKWNGNRYWGFPDYIADEIAKDSQNDFDTYMKEKHGANDNFTETDMRTWDWGDENGNGRLPYTYVDHSNDTDIQKIGQQIIEPLGETTGAIKDGVLDPLMGHEGNAGSGGSWIDNVLEYWDKIQNGGATKRTEMTNEANRLMNEQNNATNMKINADNIALQRETNAQNEALMREQWAREDSTYQRTINDMASVGMSPLAMQGLNNAGSVVGMTAPQGTQGTTAGHDETPSMTDRVTGIVALAQTLTNLKTAMVQNNKTEAETHTLEEDNKFFDKVEGSRAGIDYYFRNISTSNDTERTINDTNRYLTEQDYLKMDKNEYEFNKSMREKKMNMDTIDMIVNGLLNTAGLGIQAYTGTHRKR